MRDGHKIEAGYGIGEILRAGYGKKISWRGRNALISIGGMRDSFEFVDGMPYLNSKFVTVARKLYKPVANCSEQIANQYTNIAAEVCKEHPV